ncbi:unnamed protein product [Rhizopus microsporus]
MFLNPGRKTVFTAAIGLDTINHQIRYCLTAEYYHMTRSTQRIKLLEKIKVEKGIKGIETNVPSPKISQCAAFLVYIGYILTHVDTFLAIVKKKRSSWGSRRSCS